MEVIDIGINDLETAPLSINESKMENISTSIDPEPSSKPSVNFGPGIELLMNDKNISGSHSTNVESTRTQPAKLSQPVALLQMI